MRILDALGDELECHVSVVKIDVVLGIRFVNEIYRYTKSELIARYRKKHNVTLYCHDFARAEHIRRLHQMHVFDHFSNMTVSIGYLADSLTVMYEWIGRYKTVYRYNQRGEAYRVFLLLCESYRCYSILKLDSDTREFLFNYIYARDFIDHNLSI